MNATLALILLAFLSIYSYCVYPLVLLAARKLSGRSAPAAPPDAGLEGGTLSAARGGEPARMSLIVTAHNESERIRAKLENSLALDYDPGRLEILVASDASTDGTDAIVEGFPQAKLVRVEERKGKEHAQKQAILRSTGDVLVFTDVGTLLDKDALRRLARGFRDPRVGALSSTDKMVGEDGKPSGEGLYVRYEMLLRRLESEVRGLVGMSGSFFAARRAVCLPWAENLPSDFNTVLNCVRKGYIAVSDDSVIGYYRDIKRGQSEYQRKVRTLVRGITAFFANLELLDFRRFGFFSFQLLSHKLMRWLAPVFMILLIPATAVGVAMGDPLAQALAVFQTAFWGLAAIGFAFPPARDNMLIRVPFFFAQVNAAILAAWVRYLRGERITLWAPSRR